MFYHMSFFQKQLTSQVDKAAAKPYRKEISFFTNFTAGKMYDIQIFQKINNFSVVNDLYC